MFKNGYITLHTLKLIVVFTSISLIGKSLSAWQISSWQYLPTLPCKYAPNLWDCEVISYVFRLPHILWVLVDHFKTLLFSGEIIVLLFLHSWDP